MKYSYYPGCSLHGTAKEYDQSTREVCNSLGIELQELEGWSCCGASSAHSMDKFLALALPARNLAIAEKHNQELLVPCAACYSRFKKIEIDYKNTPEKCGYTYSGAIEIRNIIDIFLGKSVRKTIREKIKQPLAGLKVVSYYGCLLVRPPNLTEVVEYEDPQGMDQIVEFLGGESLNWPYKTDCCGGSLALSRVDIVKTLVGKLLSMAQEVGAECIVTACPMCQANIDTRQKEISQESGKNYDLPVLYITELIGIALSCLGVPKWMQKHIVSPSVMLKEKGLME
jgi:heterodisulfide reductase subunit B